MSEDDQPTSKQWAVDDVYDASTPTQPVPFGDYDLLGKIGRGGMANVYRGRLRDEPAHLMAIKCMRPKIASDDRFVEMFTREGKLALMLQHPSIVRTFDVDRAEGRVYIAMEYIPGKDLNTVLRRCQETNRRLPIPHALFVAVSIARALHYAHNLRAPQGRPLNIVNRDVSPANVRISFDGEVKLLDFGIAQAVLQVTSEIGVLKGKFAYMSPEQIRGLPVDYRSDIFSLGVVLHEMLSCERLFREESEFVLMERVRQGDIRPPSAFNQRVPPELDEIVMHAVQRDPSQRYADAEAFAAVLEPLLAGYQFRQLELGELLRNLFPSDYREEQLLLEAAATLTTDPAVAPGVAPQRPPARRRQRSRRKREQRPARPRPSARKVWMLALVLLVASVALIVVALALTAG